MCAQYYTQIFCLPVCATVCVCGTDNSLWCALLICMPIYYIYNIIYVYMYLYMSIIMAHASACSRTSSRRFVIVRLSALGLRLAVNNRFASLCRCRRRVISALPLRCVRRQTFLTLSFAVKMSNQKCMNSVCISIVNA